MNCPVCGRKLISNWEIFSGACSRHVEDVATTGRRYDREPSGLHDPEDRRRWRLQQSGLFFANDEVQRKERYFLAARQLNRIAAMYAARRAQSEDLH